ncbi:High-affnity carbon uptake protein Hat/HatR [Enhygromyxa salina]|uniref:High-affnity carbon uptake protein Hat/HatR n=1 Tax=Enhygromyxa salina TaxID=215803 RepID=A0A0C2CUQ8_9BACT|nr:serine/threonine-protein kinase [Enhygromyxa salina]KIG13315.1 High-affnity carbon uptake protein Hat/HatR [Enhygromyxa salina]
MTSSTEQTTTATHGPGPPETERGPAPVEPRRGQEVGRYVVLERLGAGAMGVVFAAYDPELDRRVAVKLLRPRGRDQASARARLVREAQVLAKLADPNVVTVHDVGDHAGQVFVAMEYVRGVTLDERVAGTEHWKSTLELLLQAGRGLAAAHEAGLVHRDFKPHNVMVSDKGRVRVMDFGLARVDAAPDPSAGAGAGVGVPGDGDGDGDDVAGTTAKGSLSQSGTITRAGALMGTPAYMAPEQFAGCPADAASDQFAFCVTCFELLYGERPYRGETVPEIAAAVTLGEVVPRPAGTRVPAWIHRIIVRGLSRDPAMRWPSMRELIAALERDPSVTRTRWLTVIAVTLAVGVAIFGQYQASDHGKQTDRAVQFCAGLDQHLVGVWDPERRAATRAALLATELVYASATWERVEAGLDAWSTAWVEHRRDACRATHVRKEQSEQVLDLRVKCLDERLRDFRATVELLAHADATVAERAVEFVGALPSVDACADVARLRARVPPPTDPKIASRITRLEDDLARARAAYRAGKYSDGAALAEPILVEARELGYPPFLARALGVVGILRQQLDPSGDAATLLDEGYMLFVANNMTAEASEVASYAAKLIGYGLGRHAEGLTWARHAEALARAAQNDVLLAAAFAAQGEVLNAQGRPHEALEAHQRALELREQVLGPRHRLVAHSWSSLGTAAGADGDHAAAMRHQERALELVREALGAEHPEVADVLNNMGNAAYALGDLDRAIELYTQSLQIRERALGSEHVEVADVLSNLGNARAERGEAEQARALLERALAIREATLDPNHPDVGASLSNLGVVVLDGGEIEAARELFRRAVQVKELALGPDHPGLASALTNLAVTEAQLGNFVDASARLTRALQIREAALGPDHPKLAFTLDGIGEMNMLMGEPAQAVAPLERALALRSAQAGDPKLLAKSRFDLAKALWASGRPRSPQRVRARALAEQAEVGLAKAGEGAASMLAEVRQWLHDHPST